MNSLIPAASLFLVVFMITPAFGETWEVTIPSGASNPSFPSHFLPQEITIRADDFVKWLNGDTAIHTVTSGSLETGPDGRFDSGYLNPGESFSIQFQSKDYGEHAYFCTIHPWITGIVNVEQVEEGFKVFHNVGAGITEKVFDLHYSVQRKLIDVNIDPAAKTISFTLSGKIENDKFVVKLPEELIVNPNSVWVDQKQVTNFITEKEDNLNTLTIPLTETAERIKILGSDVVGKAPPKKFTVTNQIFGITDKKFYHRGQSITISGEIKNPGQVYQVSVEIISPTGVTVDKRELPLQDTAKFTTTIEPTGILQEIGTYNVKIIGPASKTLVLSFDYGIKKAEFLSPHQQMKTGTSPQDVICNEGLELMERVSNGSAVCVKESSATTLIARGYSKYFG